MIDDTDIFNAAGNRTPMCLKIKEIYNVHKVNFLEQIGEDNKIIVDTDGPEQTVLNMLKPYKFVFVPLEVAQERLFVYMVNNALMTYLDVILDNSQKNRVEEIIDRYERLYDNIADHYRRFDDIYGTCVMFVFDEDYVVDILLANPPIIIEQVLHKKTTYECSRCHVVKVVNNTDVTTFLPEMRYKVVENNIKYFCENCVNNDVKLQKLKHVGE
jgi:hypothetical protein